MSQGATGHIQHALPLLLSRQDKTGAVTHAAVPGCLAQKTAAWHLALAQVPRHCCHCLGTPDTAGTVRVTAARLSISKIT
ncbi:hypothetical protein E2C01_095963 [Portunus trituberculatus]|uniref:Uncharacterized protein n=1 Tax=Portunus trituberculatus TaxID=210409 RepID=A0A5B7K0F9_PORTR|nr:hypothetical protein [Portunus trituberculatus]